jgi:hypothetical protein
VSSELAQTLLKSSEEPNSHPPSLTPHSGARAQELGGGPAVLKWTGVVSKEDNLSLALLADIAKIEPQLLDGTLSQLLVRRAGSRDGPASPSVHRSLFCTAGSVRLGLLMAPTDRRVPSVQCI